MASPTCVLVDVGSGIQVLPHGTTPYDALEQGPFHCVHLPAGWTLHWSSSSYQLTEVNEVATSLAKQTVKGDACLVHHSCDQRQLDTLLQSRPWKMAQPICQPGTPRASSSRSRQEINWHLPDTQAARDDFSNSTGGGGVKSVSCSSLALLKRTRSLQHIATANSIRQRILRSMTAVTTSGDEPYSSTPPQQSYARTRPSSKGPCGVPPIQLGSHPALDSAHVAHNCSSTSTTGPLQKHEEKAMHHSAPFLGNNNQHALTGCVVQKPAGWHSPTEAEHPANYSSSRLSSLSHHCCMAISSSSTSSVPCGAAADASASQCNVAAVQSGQPHVCASSIAWQQPPPQQVQLAAGLLQQHQPDGDVMTEQCEQQDSEDVEMNDVEAEDAVPQCTAAGSASCSPAWDELSEDVIGRIAGFMGSSLSAIIPVYLTCRSWRRAVLEDDQLLLKLSFTLNVARPFKPTSAHKWPTVTRQRHPALLLRASKLGNVSALVTRARLLDAAGCPEEAMRCWRRAAKCGAVEGQLVYGLGLYRGIAGLVQDAEEAHLWLLKALKQVQKPEAASSVSSSSSPEGCSMRTTAEAATAAGHSVGATAAATVAYKDTAVKAGCGVSVGSRGCPAGLAALTDQVLAQAGLVLGYLAFDGEGTIKLDRQEAVKYFRMSAGAGCKEAEQVLGWIYSTGQYG